MASFLGVNVGVLAVAMVLGSTSVGIGMGMGLFGVLSIIRLRSYEIAHHDIAYYFSALAIGLLAGLSESLDLLHIGLMLLVVGTLFVGDHPGCSRATGSRTCAWTPRTPTRTPCARTSKCCSADGW